MFMIHSCEDPESSKHCEITSAILGRASSQTELITRLINPYFLNALGLHLPALHPPEAHQKDRSALVSSRSSPYWRESRHGFGGIRKVGVPTGCGHPTEPTLFLSPLTMFEGGGESLKSQCATAQPPALTQPWQYGCPSIAA